MGANVERSYREIALAQKVAWAKARKLHPLATEYAGKYLNLNEQELELISDYEEAADTPAVAGRDHALRSAWQNVIFYLRTTRREKESEAA